MAGPWTMPRRPTERQVAALASAVARPLSLRAASPRARPRRAPARRQPGGDGQLVERFVELRGEQLEVRQRVEVGVEAERERAVVAHDRDPQREVLRERHHRVDRAHAAAEHVERELRAGHVRDDEVEVALARLQPRGLRHHGRRREAGQLRQQAARRPPGGTPSAPPSRRARARAARPGRSRRPAGSPTRRRPGCRARRAPRRCAPRRGSSRAARGRSSDGRARAGSGRGRRRRSRARRR